MNSDRELLELAAKAAGLTVEYTKPSVISDKVFQLFFIGNYQVDWRPLEDDGDAFRLAVKLGISILPYPVYAEQKHSVMAKQRRMSDTMRIANPTETIEPYGDEPCAATRRAIVRAAAAIAKAEGGAA